jgi:hypothetical protein
VSEPPVEPLTEAAIRAALDCTCRGRSIYICPRLISMSRPTWDALVDELAPTLPWPVETPVGAQLLAHSVHIDDATPDGFIWTIRRPDAGTAPADFPQEAAP